MKIVVVSQNLLKTDLQLPGHAVLRINLAWHNDLVSVTNMIKEYRDKKIFIDIPVGRKKPPNHKHDIDHIADIANAFKNIEYVAISNVEDPKTARYYSKKFRGKIVPKIETYKGVMNSGRIIKSLPYRPAVLMLDHEDLFSNLVHLKIENRYLEVVSNLVDVCKKMKAQLLRVQGIIFANTI